MKNIVILLSVRAILKSCLAVLFITIQVTVCVGQTATLPAGAGTEQNPYIIASLENLYWIAANSSRWDKHYLQTSDIDASSTESWVGGGWIPIGNNTTKFTGSYDGGKYGLF